MILKYFSWNKKTDLFLCLKKKLTFPQKYTSKIEYHLIHYSVGQRQPLKNKEISYGSKCQSGPVCIGECVYKMYVW